MSDADEFGRRSIVYKLAVNPSRQSRRLRYGFRRV
jgi:hypothetical protein